ncbi:hypothetical protein M5689_020409 [Euphorbia peplus]|nr:hypothetical protein M5689_020409 [Euphorbia peplus]
MWRVAVGTGIKILKSRWVPSIPGGRPLILRNHPPSDYVNCLIDSASQNWNVELVNHCFLPDDAKAILSLPIRHNSGSDKLFWSESRNGVYSVKLGYEIALSHNGIYSEMTSSSVGPNLMWKDLWKLDLPPKIIHFLWGCCHNILPCPDNLSRRKIPTPNTCVFCGGEGSSLIHILKQCRKAKRRWKLIDLSSKPYKIEDNTPLEWITAVFHELSKSEFSLFSSAIWMMWFNHNQVRHGEHPMEDSTIIRGANKAIEKPFNPPNSPNEKVNNVLKWTPPPAGYVKLNCDASFRENGDYCAVGFIARNELEKVLMSGACPVGNCWSVLHAELLAILNGVYFAMESGFHNLLVASDCKQAVDSILIKNDDSYVDVVA